MQSGISKLDLKRINRMQVLRTIWEAGPISRVDLSQNPPMPHLHLRRERGHLPW